MHEALQNHGITVNHLEPDFDWRDNLTDHHHFQNHPKKPVIIKRKSFVNTQDELISVAHFMKNKVLEHPDKAVACVVPDLTEKRELIEKIFLLFLPKNSSNPIIYNISSEFIC